MVSTGTRSRLRSRLRLDPAADVLAMVRQEVNAGALDDDDGAEALELRADDEYWTRVADEPQHRGAALSKRTVMPLIALDSADVRVSDYAEAKAVD
jgi:hypothetical protein